MADFGDFNIELDHNNVKVGDAERAQSNLQKPIQNQSPPSIPNYSSSKSNNND